MTARTDPLTPLPLATGSYCLRCLGSMDPEPGVRSTCSRCGYVNLASHRRIYWNRDPRLVEIEVGLKTLVIFATGLIVFAAVTSGLHMGGKGAGYYFAIPFIGGFVFWNTIGKITRHGHYFSAGTVWTTFFLLPPVFWVLTLAFVYQSPQESVREMQFNIGATVTSASLALAVLTHRLSLVLENWKRRKLGHPLHRGSAILRYGLPILCAVMAVATGIFWLS